MSVDPHVLTGAYSLNAVDTEERTGFEHHLDSCASCSEEVVELQATAARLGMAADVTPPAALRGRVMAEVARTPQLPPLLPQRHASPSRQASRSGQRGLLAAAAALLLLAVSLGGLAVRDRNELAGERQRTAALSAVLSAPDARTVRTRGRGGGSATVVVSPSQGRAAFVAGGLPAPPGSRTYQLWSLHGSQAVSLGLLHRRPDGSAEPVIIDGPGGSDAFGVTVEPAGGSPAPTTKPVMLLKLPT